MKNEKEYYVVTATVEKEGVVLLELFDSIEKALAFEDNGVYDALCYEYGKNMRRDSSLQIGFYTKHVNGVESPAVVPAPALSHTEKAKEILDAIKARSEKPKTLTAGTAGMQLVEELLPERQVFYVDVDDEKETFSTHKYNAGEELRATLEVTDPLTDKVIFTKGHTYHVYSNVCETGATFFYSLVANNGKTRTVTVELLDDAFERVSNSPNSFEYAMDLI